MPEPDRDLAGALAGVGGPRPLPPALRERLLASLPAAGGDLLHGVDAPRPLPAEVRTRLYASMTGAATEGRVAVGARRSTRLLGVAAAVLVVLGLVAAGTRPVRTGLARDVAIGSSTTTAATLGGSTGGGSGILASTTTAPPPPTTSPGVVALAESDPAYAALETFSSCQELLDWIRPRATAETDEWGLPYPGGSGARLSVLRPGESAGPPVSMSPPIPSASPAMGSGGSVGGRSGTNVQEAGVDEPDLLKVTTRALALLAGDSIDVVATGPGGPRSTASIPLAGWERLSPYGLLVDGERVTAVSSGYPGAQPLTRLTTVDLADPDAPSPPLVADLDGAYLDARAAAGTIHVVTGWTPGPFAFVYPENPSDPDQVARARAENQRIVRESTIEQWVPSSVPCEQVRHPRDLAGFALSLLWSVPMSDPGHPAVVGLLADPGSLYASTGTVVIATTRWDYAEVARAYERGDGVVPPPTVRTNLHRFALEAGTTRYVASGSVPGYLLSSWSLSDHEGHLRVASTDGFPGAGTSSSSTVTVLDDDGAGRLVAVGAVEGLGPDQRIVGVRFEGPVGYVVTYQRTDPLYVLDLADPTRPRLRGALEVTGFSGYLHPLGDGRLLGVGIEADEAGVTTGGAVSVYDVADLDRPTLAQRITDPGARYVATNDPHGFLLWGPTGDVVLPTNNRVVTGMDEQGQVTATGENGFDVFRTGPGGLTFAGRIRHDGQGDDAAWGVASRAAMVDGVLYTVSSAGVLATDPTTLTDLGYADLPGTPRPAFRSND